MYRPPEPTYFSESQSLITTTTLIIPIITTTGLQKQKIMKIFLENSLFKCKKSGVKWAVSLKDVSIKFLKVFKDFLGNWILVWFPFFFCLKVKAMTTTKKALQNRVEQLTQANEQFQFATRYLLFDLEATRRERDGIKAQVILLREELADLRQNLEDGGLIK